MKLKIVEFNIEYGGYSKKVPYTKYVELIKDNDIDILIIMEPRFPKITGKVIDYNDYTGSDELIRKSAQELNYNYETQIFDFPVSIISKYPIEKCEYEYTFKIILPETHFYLVPIHLSDTPCTFYSKRKIRYDDTPFEVSDYEAASYSFLSKEFTLKKSIKAFEKEPEKVIVISGDFNEPHHKDDEIPWKCSKFLEDIGIYDSMIKNKKMFDEYNYDYANSTCDITSTEQPPCRIDYIYTNANVKSSGVMEKYNDLSDHIPIYAIIEIGEVTEKKSWGRKFLNLFI